MAERRHLLIVEDEFVAALALEDFLTHRGYRVTLASDGLQGLERFALDPAAAVLTDLRMPRMGGQEMVRRLRQDAPDLPIIVMTGFMAFDSEPGDLAAALGPPSVVMRKPVDLDAIAGALDRLLAGGPAGSRSGHETGAGA